MHPEVSRELYEEQIQRITGNPDLILDRGWLLLTHEYPVLTIAVRHRATAKVRVFRFMFDDWNDTPPSLTLLDAETGEELPGHLWPTGCQSHWHQKGWTSEGGIETNRPFMCMVGIREYHTHRSHVGDRWDNYKNLAEYDIVGIVIQVTEVFQKSNV